MAAGLATLQELGGDRYAALEDRVARLATGLVAAARAAGRDDVAVARVGTLLTVFFCDRVPLDGADAQRADRAAFARFFASMREQGVLLPPSQFEAWFPGFAHGDREVDLVLEAAAVAFQA
jgi:glutamate-1-semialdehyde 2,1-aminomutase